MKREIEKRKKIEAAAAVIAVVLALFIVGSVPVIIADTSGPDDPIYDGTVTVFLNATDADSGVAGIHYAINPLRHPINYTYVEGDKVVLIVEEPGNYTIHYYAVDNFGNEETPQTKSFVIYKDDVAPGTTCELQGKMHQP